MVIFHCYVSSPDDKHPQTVQDGAPKIAKLPYFSGFMVDITIVNRGYGL